MILVSSFLVGSIPQPLGLPFLGGWPTSSDHTPRLESGAHVFRKVAASRALFAGSGSGYSQGSCLEDSVNLVSCYFSDSFAAD